MTQLKGLLLLLSVLFLSPGTAQAYSELLQPDTQTFAWTPKPALIPRSKRVEQLFATAQFVLFLYTDSIQSRKGAQRSATLLWNFTEKKLIKDHRALSNRQLIWVDCETGSLTVMIDNYYRLLHAAGPIYFTNPKTRRIDPAAGTIGWSVVNTVCHKRIRPQQR